MILSSATMLLFTGSSALFSTSFSHTRSMCYSETVVCGDCLQGRKHSTNQKTAGQASVPTLLDVGYSEAGCGSHYLCLSWLPLIKLGNDRCFSYVCITEDPNTWEKQLRSLWLIWSQSFRRLILGSIGPRYLGRASQRSEHMGRCLLHGWPGRRRRRKRKD